MSTAPPLSLHRPVPSIINCKLSELASICARHRVLRLTLFGSALRDDFDETQSDLDFVVQFAPDDCENGARRFFGLQSELGRLFHRRVDLLDRRALGNPYLIKEIDRTEQIVYNAPHQAQPDIAERLPMNDDERTTNRTLGVLHHIDQACRDLHEMTAGKTLEDYKHDKALRLIAERLFITIGEAVSRHRHADVDVESHITAATNIIAFRNLLVHNYDLVEDAIVWGVIQEDLPRLHDEVTRMMNAA